MSSDPASSRFHAVSLSVAAVAAAATYGTKTAMLPAPAMFLGWVAFDLAGPSWRGGATNTGAFLLGLAPTSKTLLILGAAGVIGGLACALAGLAQSLFVPKMETRHA